MIGGRTNKVIEFLYAPIFFIGFLVAGAALWRATGRVASLALLSCVAIGVSFLVERLAPFERSFNKSHNDRLRDAIHASVNQLSNMLPILFYSLLAAVAPRFGLWPYKASIWLQLGLAILIADFAITMVHFASHRWTRLWKFHKTHHSVERLYGFNGLMRHPIHQAIEVTAAVLLLMLAGIPKYVAYMLAYAGLLQLLLQHSNVNIRIGRLAYVWAIAPTHRLHHLNAMDIKAVNFGLFTHLWDHLFGSFKLRLERPLRPNDFGMMNYPKTFFAQITEPFKRLKT